MIGHAHMVTGDPRDLLLRAPDIGPIVRVYLGPRASYLLTTPELIREHARRGGFPADRVLEIAEIIDPTTAEDNALAAVSAA